MRAFWKHFKKISLHTIALVVAGSSLAFFVPARPAEAATGNILPPFDIGQQWNICQGYNGPITHSGNLLYSLDLTGSACDNSAAGRNVRASKAGTISFWSSPTGTLCINATGGGSYKLTHIDASQTTGSVSAGAIVGTVATAGNRQNAGVPHIHFQIWTTSNCAGSTSVPFDAAHNARICGAPDLTPGGAGTNGEWSGTTFTGASCYSSQWVPLSGDWNGNGTETIGLYDPGTATFHLRNSNTSGSADITAVFGSGGNWMPLVGDWDNNGTTTIGVYDPSTARFYLSNSNTSPNADISSVFGSANWVPLAGNWDGYQGDTIGVYDPSTARFHLSNYNTSPQDNYSTVFGNGGNWVPLIGNWDGYQGDTIGVYDPTLARFHLSNYNTSPQANYSVVYGSGGSWKPVLGDWDTNGTTTVGIYNPAGATFYLSNSNTSGVTSNSFTYGNPN